MEGEELPVWVEGFGLTEAEASALLIALQRAWDKEPSPVGAAALRRMIDRIAITEGEECEP